MLQTNLFSGAAGKEAVCLRRYEGVYGWLTPTSVNKALLMSKTTTDRCWKIFPGYTSFFGRNLLAMCHALSRVWFSPGRGTRPVLAFWATESTDWGFKTLTLKCLPCVCWLIDSTNQNLWNFSKWRRGGKAGFLVTVFRRYASTKGFSGEKWIAVFLSP